MKNILPFIFIFIGIYAVAQPSLLLKKKTAEKLDKISWKIKDKTEQCFDSIINQREKGALYKRLDTLDYDFCYLLETYVVIDDSIEIRSVERYYKANLAYPVFTYYNSKYAKMDSADTVIAIEKEFKNTYSRKKIKYKKRPVFYHGCIRNPELDRMRLENQKKVIENTYIVASVINNQDNTVKTSFQRPPRKAKVKPRYRGISF